MTENKLICPFCGGEMIGSIGHSVCHYNPKCPIYDEFVPQEVLDKLDRTRKALDVAVDALDAGKTLADIAGFKMLAVGLEEALNKITALEQKDK